MTYEVDENNPYPAAFTGHVRLNFKDGSMQEVHQGFMRGGRDAPLTQAEIEEKFHANCRYGGHEDSENLLACCRELGSLQGDFSLIRLMADDA